MAASELGSQMFRYSGPHAISCQSCRFSGPLYGYNFGNPPAAVAICQECDAVFLLETHVPL